MQHSDSGLFEYQAKLLLAVQVFIHQHTDGNCQGLGTNVSGHVQDQGLEQITMVSLGY